MNILPVPAEANYDISRVREGVGSVDRAQGSRESLAQTPQEQTLRTRAPRVVDEVEREAVINRYADALQQPSQREDTSPQQRRVLDAYSSVSQMGSRDQLTDLLGVSEYA